MGWVKKDAEVLGFEVEEPDAKNVLVTNYYHMDCHCPNEECKIAGYVTKETLEKNPEAKLLCDRCGKEIK